MRIVDYPKTEQILKDNLFLVDTDTGTKTILGNILAEALFDMINKDKVMAKIDVDDLTTMGAYTAGDSFIVFSQNEKKTIDFGDLFFKLIDAHQESSMGGGLSLMPLD